MSYPVGIAFAEALAAVRRIGAQHRSPIARMGLRAARGHVLSEDVVAPIALPPFDNSAMDGFALRHADLDAERETSLRLIGTQFAGVALGLRVGCDECVRITTGAPMPEGADTVVIKEHTHVEGECVVLRPGTPRGANVRRVGEDVRAADRVFVAGTTLRSAALGLIASLGYPDVPVAQRPSVAVFTSGDELRPAGSTLSPGEIFDSNSVLLQALLAEDGFETLSWPALPDDSARLTSALHDAAQGFDLVITCGGVSAGEKDLLPALLAEHGNIHFWKVMMRPGMPVLFGQWERALFLGLPGNPVSVLATFRRLALPLLDAMQGRLDRAPSLRACLLDPVRKTHPRLEFRRGQLSCGADGRLGIRAHPALGSHRLRGAAESNALLVLPEDATELPVGAVVDVEPYGAILRE